jgi:Transcriptional activator of glycolytic enzymes
MALALATEEDPLDASLEKVMPGVHQRLKGTDDKVDGLYRHINERFNDLQEDVHEGFKSLVQQHGDVLRESCQLVGASLVNVGHHVMNSPGGVSVGTPSKTLTGEPASPSVPCTQFQAEEPDPVQLASTFRMKAKHNTLTDLWQEWFGLGEWEDEFGGVAGRNEKFGAKWRKEAKALDKSQYSRTNRVIVAVSSSAHARGLQPEDVVAEWEPVFSACKQSVANLVRALQELNILPKKKARGKKKVGGDE